MNVSSDEGSLRDYFAAQALQGFCANPHEGISSWHPDVVARNAYEHADAMLKAREAPADLPPLDKVPQL